MIKYARLPSFKDRLKVVEDCYIVPQPILGGEICVSTELLLLFASVLHVWWGRLIPQDHSEAMAICVILVTDINAAHDH